MNISGKSRNLRKAKERSQMLRIDKAILDANGAICENIAQLAAGDRGLLSQNILAHIATLWSI